jgi:hypothetical protein
MRSFNCCLWYRETLVKTIYWDRAEINAPRERDKYTEINPQVQGDRRLREIEQQEQRFRGKLRYRFLDV